MQVREVPGGIPSPRRTAENDGVDRAPEAFGFTAEFPGDDPVYDDLDDYLRVEFGDRYPGWEPRFGKMTWFDPRANRYDHAYLLSGKVPDAESHPEAEGKVRELLDDIGKRFKSVGSRAERALAEPHVRVWKR